MRRELMKAVRGYWVRWPAAVVLTAALLPACDAGNERPPSGAEASVDRIVESFDPEVPAALGTFFHENPRLGLPTSAEQTADWARGTRYRVRTAERTYLVYLVGDSVVTVYDQGTTDDPQRREVYRAP